MADNKSFSSASDLDKIIETLNISPMRKEFLRTRWLKQQQYMSKWATQNQKPYYRDRVIIIAFGALVPALTSLNAFIPNLSDWVRYPLVALTIILSVSVSILVALEEFFKRGERYRHYRGISEYLKMEGWEYFQLTGQYAEFPDHESAYTRFAGEVEKILKADADEFMTKILQTKQAQDQLNQLKTDVEQTFSKIKTQQVAAVNTGAYSSTTTTGATGRPTIPPSTTAVPPATTPRTVAPITTPATKTISPLNQPSSAQPAGVVRNVISPLNAPSTDTTAAPKVIQPLSASPKTIAPLNNGGSTDTTSATKIIPPLSK